MSVVKFIDLAISLYNKQEDTLALAQVCHALESTAKRQYPDEKGVGNRFKKIVHDNRRLIFGVVTDFQIMCHGNILFPDGKGNNRDISYYVYKLIRNALVHEGELDERFEMWTAHGLGTKDGRFMIPRTIVLALILVVMSQPCNASFYLNRQLNYFGIGMAFNEIRGVGGETLADQLEAACKARRQTMALISSGFLNAKKYLLPIPLPLISLI
jgi:hypothetical protein